MTRGFEEIKGHARPVKVLGRTLQSGRIPHAYLFWGPDGVGKKKAAHILGQILLCQDPKALEVPWACGVCPSCKKCKTGEHPDFYTLSPGEKDISVEEVRNLISNISFQAYEKGRKVVIIEDAFHMSISGANALLKTVEEPPAGTHIIMLAEHRDRLLPTLVSRCRCLRFDPLKAEEVAVVLESLGVERQKAQSLALYAEGSVERAMQNSSEVITSLEDELDEVYRDFWSMGVGSACEICERWSKDKELLPLRLAGLERRFLDSAPSEPSALVMVERVMRVRDWVDRNVNPEMALNALFLSRLAFSWDMLQ